MTYTLWDIGTANMVQAYASDTDALAFVRRAIERNGQQYADTLALAFEDEQGEVSLIAQGQALAEMAHRELSTRRKVG